jgi:hypothetical protein
MSASSLPRNGPRRGLGRPQLCLNGGFGRQLGPRLVGTASGELAGGSAARAIPYFEVWTDSLYGSSA